MKNRITNSIKWLAKFFGGVLAFCLLAIPFLIQPVDRTPLHEMEYYKEMMARLDTFQLNKQSSEGEYLKAGWAKESITPAYYMDMAGYGPREKSNCIHDSVFAKVFVFDNGTTKSAFITLDLLIFPPKIVDLLKEKVASAGFQFENLYLSATHTHSAPGGWADGLAGRLLAGRYDDAYVKKITEAILQALKKADASKQEAEIGYGQANGFFQVRNRLNLPDSKIDPWVRLVKVRKNSGEQALMMVYSAHASCMRASYRCISGDYPNEVAHLIEATKKVDFVMYAAGMVGSHSPMPVVVNKQELSNIEYIEAYGDSLSKVILKRIDSIKYQQGNNISISSIDLALRSPHLKISKDWRVRPWVFKALFGDHQPNLKILKINNLVFIGTPCDFSGELMEDFYALCKEKQVKLIITSFNGGYIGYINVDKYYDANKAETRDMNWFGPYNQAYFTEIIQRILKKV